MLLLIVVSLLEPSHMYRRSFKLNALFFPHLSIMKNSHTYTPARACACMQKEKQEKKLIFGATKPCRKMEDDSVVAKTEATCYSGYAS